MLKRSRTFLRTTLFGGVIVPDCFLIGLFIETRMGRWFCDGFENGTLYTAFITDERGNG